MNDHLTERPVRSLAGLVVLVIGAEWGVGRGVALAAAAYGASVVVGAEHEEAAQAVVAEIERRGDKATPVRCDDTHRADAAGAVRYAVETYGALHALVHNAAGGTLNRPVPLEQIGDKDWDDTVSTALRASYFCAQEAWPHLRTAGGSLVVLTSTAGIEGSSHLPAYSTMTAAQHAFVKSLAREWGPYGVRVNAVAPGGVRTETMTDLLGREPVARDRLIERAALRRLGDPEADVGSAVCFLIGPDSAFVTGHTLIVGGGAGPL